MKVKSESEVIQSCPTFCDTMDCSLQGSSVHGIFQARVLEWGAIAFSSLSATDVTEWEKEDFSIARIEEDGQEKNSGKGKTRRAKGKNQSRK